MLAPKGYKSRAAAESTGFSVAGSVPGIGLAAYEMKKEYGSWGALGSRVKGDVSKAYTAARKVQAGKLKTFRNALKAGGN